MNHLAKLYKNRAEELQEKLSLLERQYFLICEEDKKDDDEEDKGIPSGWEGKFQENGKDVYFRRNPKTGEYEFSQVSEPLTSPSGTLESIPVVGKPISFGMEMASEHPVLALGAGIPAALALGYLGKKASGILPGLEKGRLESIRAGRAAAELQPSVTQFGTRKPMQISSEFRSIEGERPKRTLRSGFGLFPEKDKRISSKVFREFEPTKYPDITRTTTSSGKTKTIVTPNYTTEKMPGYTFKLSPTGEMVPDQPLPAQTGKLRTGLRRAGGLGLIGLGLMSAYNDIQQGEIPYAGTAETLAGSAMVAPEALKVAKVAEPALKMAGKEVGKIAAKIGLKKIPLYGAAIGLGLAADRASAGDWLGAAGEAASGIASTVPGLGTAVSAAIDVGLLGRDLANMEEDEEKKKQEILKLQMGNASKPSEVKLIGSKL